MEIPEPKVLTEEEQKRLQQQEYYRINKHKIDARSKKYYKDHKAEREAEWKTLPPEEMEEILKKRREYRQDYRKRKREENKQKNSTKIPRPQEHESNSHITDANFLEEPITEDPMTQEQEKIFLNNLGVNSGNLSKFNNNLVVTKSFFDEENSNNNYGNNYNSAQEPSSPNERILDNSHSLPGYNTNNSSQANSIFNLGSHSLPGYNTNNSAQTKQKSNSKFGGGFKRKSKKPLKSKKSRKTKRRSHKYMSKIRK
jgi:hypothetical protein